MKKKVVLLLPLSLLRFAAGAQAFEEEQDSSWYNEPIVWIVLSAIALVALVISTQNRKKNRRDSNN